MDDLIEISAAEFWSSIWAKRKPGHDLNLVRRKCRHLFDLPTELVLETFSYLEPKTFREGLETLTISKQWYEFAWPMLIRDLDLTADKLVYLTHNPAILDRIKPHVVAVKVVIDGYEHFALHGSPSASLSIPDMLRLVGKYHTRVNHSLRALMAMLRQSPRLRSVDVRVHEVRTHSTLKALFNRRPWRVKEHRHVLKPAPSKWSESPPLLFAIPFGSRITDLTLDTGFDYCKFSAGLKHVCSVINSQLPSLRSLRYRTRYICPLLLEIPEKEPQLKLKEVIINLDVPEDPWVRGRYKDEHHARPCKCYRAQPRRNALDAAIELRQLIKTKLTELATRMKTPQMVRLIYLDEIRYRAYAHDILTDKRMMLKWKEYDWDYAQGNWAQ
ncbi:hypothetical protein QBC44DRAFT_386300 [Cladorrhinum sp. PSN332]|nr:hypothetical protein QBC44DRAFT_386300 [Cladorrhinum sp. PSN332]